MLVTIMIYGISTLYAMAKLIVSIYHPIKFVIEVYAHLKQLQKSFFIVFQHGIYVKFKPNVTYVKMVR